MSDDFEIDENDDNLLNSVYIPSNESRSPTKRSIEPNGDERITILKKSKLEDHNEPLSQLSPELKCLRSNNPNALKRIFPGPAGILADGNETEACSQRTASIFQEGPWREMSKDFKLGSSCHLYDQFNIAWIKKEATTNQFANQKAPFLAAILLSLEVSDGLSLKSVNVTLKDTTGTIQGNIIYSLYEQYASHFILGSVLILVQFGVLSCTCDKCDNYHLTITPKNLSAIYNNQGIITIKKVEPQEVLSDFVRQKRELTLSAKNQAVPKQNGFVGFNSKCNFTGNNTNRFQRSAFCKNVSSRNVNNIGNPPLNVRYKEVLSKHRESIENRLDVYNKNCSNENKNSNSTSFKKESEATYKSCSPTDLLEHSFSYLNKNIDRRSPDNKSTESSLNNTPPPTNNGLSKIRDDCANRLETENKPIRNSSGSPPKKVFTFKKIPLPDETSKSNFPADNNSSNDTLKLDNVCSSSFKISGSQISVTVDNVEDEKLWKDVLDDVDVNSLFDDDYETL